MLVLKRLIAIVVLPLALGCVGSAANERVRIDHPLNLGTDRERFEAAVTEGYAFALIAACEPASEIRGVVFLSGTDEIVALFGDDPSGLYAVDPRRFRLKAAIGPGGTSPVRNSRNLPLEPGTITFVGGIASETSSADDPSYSLVLCRESTNRLARLYTYPIARLPFFVVPPGR